MDLEEGDVLDMHDVIIRFPGWGVCSWQLFEVIDSLLCEVVGFCVFYSGEEGLFRESGGYCVVDVDECPPYVVSGCELFWC